MIDEPPWPFLMTPRQHLQWARILHRKGKPEKAQRHEQLARAIERIARRQAEHNADRVPPFESSGAKKAPRERG
jgi:hypothetical protein